jgi:magnesium-transporting ATPase (P-type)
MASSFTRFLDHTQRRITFGRNPLDEWSALRRDLYLTTHNTHNRQTSMPPAGFEPTISASERPQTYVLDRAVTGTWPSWLLLLLLFLLFITWEQLWYSVTNSNNKKTTATTKWNTIKLTTLLLCNFVNKLGHFLNKCFRKEWVIFTYISIRGVYRKFYRCSLTFSTRVTSLTKRACLRACFLSAKTVAWVTTFHCRGHSLKHRTAICVKL